MRTPLIAGNWKMHTTPSEARVWLDRFLAARAGATAGPDVLLNVPATHLLGLADAAADAGVALGGQDLSAHDDGAYTGEIAGSMLRDAGASHVIVGHSERRAMHHETDEVVAAKLRAALRHGLVPILCVGENEEQRDADRAREVVLGQLRAALAGADLPSADAFVVAYEPVWAIGTGRSASTADAQEMCAAVRATLRDDRPELADGVRIVYGGSMKPGNAAELLDAEDIDGGLIGGASLDVDDLLAIAGAAS